MTNRNHYHMQVEDFHKNGIAGSISGKLNYYFVNTRIGMGLLGGLIFFLVAFFIGNTIKFLQLFFKKLLK